MLEDIYRVEQLASGEWVVARTDYVGMTIPYHSKRVHYTEPCYSAVWDKWLAISNNQRKKFKMKSMELSKQNFAVAEKACCSKNDLIVVDDLVPLSRDEAYKQRVQYWCTNFNSVYGATPEQKGINPMAYNNSPTTAAATVAVSAPKSDAQIQREYLLSRLDGLNSRWDDTPAALRARLRKLFHIDGPSAPTKPQDLIDLIKSGKFTLDQKKIDRLLVDQEDAAEYEDEDYDIFSGYNALNFFTFEGYPKPDHNGYAKAITLYQADVQKTRDTIVTADAATGLAALHALESWTPPAAQVAAPN